jgi:ubiquinone/menaquinone biosynthesis C-methylase UbiE
VLANEFRGMNPDAEVNGAAGFRVYTPRTLAVYDWLVHGFSNRFAWKCPAARLSRLYRENVAARHLEIGAGTGLYLDRLPADRQFESLLLADAQPECLKRSSQRLRRFQPETISLNLLDADSFQALAGRSFDSVALNYVLHCLPGGIHNLPKILRQLYARIHRDAKLFGSTILQTEQPPNWLARRLLRHYQQEGIFGNKDDQLDQLHQMLASSFENFTLQPIGQVAVFEASRYRTTT